MRRISIPWLFKVIESIQAVGHVKSGTVDFDKWFILYNTRSNLIGLYGTGIYSGYLRVSAEAAENLFTALNSLAPEVPNYELELTEMDAWGLKTKSETLLQLLMPELGVLPSFVVDKKGAFDTITVIENGLALFPDDLGNKVPESKIDAGEVGKALAFEVATACGFHVFRVLESVLRRYWTVISNGADHPHLRTIGKYAQELDKLENKDKRIVEALKQIGSLHRNPLAHPEVILTIEEAISTLGLARSIIDVMLKALPESKETEMKVETSVISASAEAG